MMLATLTSRRRREVRAMKLDFVDVWGLWR